MSVGPWPWSPIWLGKALALEAQGLSRTQIAERLGVSRGTVLRRLWEYHNPDGHAAELKARSGRARRHKGLGQRGAPSLWDESRLTETWADRKARRAKARQVASEGAKGT